MTPLFDSFVHRKFPLFDTVVVDDGQTSISSSPATVSTYPGAYCSLLLLLALILVLKQ